MIGWRSKTWRRFGAALGGAALYAQLIFASWSMLALAAPGDPANAFGDHALCLAGQDGAKPQGRPDGAPTLPNHVHGAFCCLWHSLPALQPVATAAPMPVAYPDIVPTVVGDVPATASASFDPANARAPPLPA